MRTDRRLLILGASGRAAASSASRAGFDPAVLDLFADRDLVARHRADRVAQDAYPGALPDLARLRPDSPWIYTGSLENHPALVDRIARDRPLLGIGGEPLRAIRDPAAWTGVLRRAGLPAPEVIAAGDDPPGRGRWLDKPLASAGGRGIRRFESGGSVAPGRFLQEYVRGRPYNACFVGDGRSARLVGVTRQLLARSKLGPRVLYRGSVGPWPLDPGDARDVARIGAALAAGFGLRGLFGVDLVHDGAGAWPVEINPRYSASVEVLEEALGLTLLAEHARAFGLDPPPGVGSDSNRRGAVAKVILFARREARAPVEWPWSDPGEPWPRVADLPTAGTAIAPGDPVLTVFGRGATAVEALGRLRAEATAWRRIIAAWPRA